MCNFCRQKSGNFWEFKTELKRELVEQNQLRVEHALKKIGALWKDQVSGKNSNSFSRYFSSNFALSIDVS
jgi:hypothetical protein